VVIRLQVQARASKTETSGLVGDPPRLKIRVSAPPVEGAANDELLRYLAGKLGLPRSRLEILRGESGRYKQIVCAEITVENATTALLD
jgi:uncharacterized protein